MRRVRVGPPLRSSARVEPPMGSARGASLSEALASREALALARTHSRRSLGAPGAFAARRAGGLGDQLAHVLPSAIPPPPTFRSGLQRADRPHMETLAHVLGYAVGIFMVVMFVYRLITNS
jgi:hypothetical protein